MTTMKLRQSVLQDVVSLLDNDEAMKELQKCVSRLKKKIEKKRSLPVNIQWKKLNCIYKNRKRDFDKGNMCAMKKLLNKWSNGYNGNSLG